jgi:hypothetical protein
VRITLLAGVVWRVSSTFPADTENASPGGIGSHCEKKWDETSMTWSSSRQRCDDHARLFLGWARNGLLRHQKEYRFGFAEKLASNPCGCNSGGHLVARRFLLVRGAVDRLLATLSLLHPSIGHDISQLAIVKPDGRTVRVPILRFSFARARKCDTQQW